MKQKFIPTLYYYEHCPYCIRVLVFAGLAGIELKYRVLPNDDEATPIQMIGKKMLPILQTAANVFLSESLDIIAYLSRVYHHPVTVNSSLIRQVEKFLSENRLLIYKLEMPRWVDMPYKEFATESARNYFIGKKSKTIGSFDLALKKTPVFSRQLSEALNEKSELFEILTTQLHSYAAIQLFSGLYGIATVKDFNWPAPAGEFMQAMMQQSNIVKEPPQNAHFGK
ncbi:MAG: hypothetical protein CSA45_03035 [Gammaproteobacteria bacterium]|nr:MAG: hypothetical protein CSA45_03035 [Gammaproteobacteria bacterium]